MSAAPSRLGIPFVVAAASGTGKTTVCRRLIERNREIGGRPIEFSVSHTTRPRRSQEVDGVDYHFVSDDRFQRLADEDAFLEWATYNENRYGTSWSSVEEPVANGFDVLLEIEVQGAGQVRERRDDARFVFLLPPSIGALTERLQARGTDTSEQIARRLEHSRRELAAAVDFDYAVVNDHLDRCVEQLLDIVRAERCGGVTAVRRRFAPAAALAVLQVGKDTAGRSDKGRLF